MKVNLQIFQARKEIEWLYKRNLSLNAVEECYPCLSHIHKNIPAWLPKCELNQNDTKGHAKVDEEKHTRPWPYTKKYRKMKKARNRSGYPHGRAQLVSQCQTVSPENIHRSNLLWTKQVIFKNIYVYRQKYMS